MLRERFCNLVLVKFNSSCSGVNPNQFHIFFQAIFFAMFYQSFVNSFFSDVALKPSFRNLRLTFFGKGSVDSEYNEIIPIKSLSKNRPNDVWFLNRHPRRCNFLSVFLFLKRDGVQDKFLLMVFLY